MVGVLASLSVILVVVLFGSLVPQGLPPEAYLERFGASAGQVFLALGLDDIFRTRGVALVGMILFLQLTACTFRRLRLLHGGVRLWVAGSVLLHIGLMIFLASVGISLWQGRIVMVEAPEGKAVPLTQQGFPFDLRLENFTIEYYPDQHAVRQYRSEVSLLRDGRVLKRGSLEVNEPLGFEGVKIYQMSYGWVVEGTVRRLPDGAPEPFSVNEAGWVSWSDAGREPLRVAMMSDPDRTGPGKAAMAFMLAPKSGARRSGVVIAGDSVVSGGVEIHFDRLSRSSGLQLKEDPGINGIFGGLVLALTGLVLRYWPTGRERT